jgi:hypothetical protein
VGWVELGRQLYHRSFLIEFVIDLKLVAFIADVREETKTHSLVYLQKQLIFEIIEET